MSELIKDYRERYERAAHAVQSGVASEIDISPGTSASNPKHLRTGLNLVMCDLGSLAALLIKKGVITDEEYLEAICIGTEKEKERYEAILSRHLDGVKVELG